MALQALVIRKGFFSRKNPAFDKIQRFLCKSYRTCLSETSETLGEGQKRPDLHRPIYMLLASGVSQRRIARICATTQVTVARKLVRMARFALIAQRQRLAATKNSVNAAVFDQMETFEYS